MRRLRLQRNSKSMRVNETTFLLEDLHLQSKTIKLKYAKIFWDIPLNAKIESLKYILDSDEIILSVCLCLDGEAIKEIVFDKNNERKYVFA